MAYEVTNEDGTIATTRSAIAAIRATEQHFQCGIADRDQTLVDLRKFGRTVAVHCMDDSIHVFIDSK